MSSSQYGEQLVAHSLCRGDVIEEHALTEIVIKRIDASIRQSIREYRGKNREATLYRFAFNSTSLVRLKLRDISTKRTQPSSAEQIMKKNHPLQWKST